MTTSTPLQNVPGDGAVQRPRILVIDDLPANLLLLGKALAKEYDLQIATSGSMGLALARRAVPDLVLLDVMMPEMDGYETCRRFKADPALKVVPIIFVTGQSDTEDEARGLRLGAADYIVKPFNVEIARQRIRNLIERERLRRELQAHRDLLEAKVEERTLALSIAKEAAEAGSRTKTAFLRNVSHELRTPMSQIVGLTDLMSRHGGDAKQHVHLGQIRRAARQLLDMVEHVLDLTYRESGRFTLQETEVCLGDLLARLAMLFREDAAAKGLSWRLEIAPAFANLIIRTDARRLGQILQALLDNAVKFTQTGGVTLRVYDSGTDARPELICFEVSDTGSGIPPAQVSRIFEPFGVVDGSLTRPCGGSGLGLSISRDLARRMGGGIELESTPGAGSVFRLQLPLPRLGRRDDKQAPSRLPSEALREQFAGHRVLVAEDDEVLREILVTLLADVGLAPEEAADGAEAISAFERTPCRMVLVDVEIRDLDPVRFMQSLRALPGGAEVPIRALGADADPDRLRACLQAGMTGPVEHAREPETLYASVLQSWSPTPCRR